MIKKRASMQVDPEFRKIIRQEAAKQDVNIMEFTRQFAKKSKEGCRGSFFERFKI